MFLKLLKIYPNILESHVPSKNVGILLKIILEQQDISNQAYMIATESRLGFSHMFPLQ